MSNKTDELKIRIAPALKKQLLGAAKKQGISMSQLVTKALTDLFVERPMTEHEKQVAAFKASMAQASKR